ncbi:hypothetical protein DV711_06075 [Motiliproteus coralliicola]|uniref:Large polyvalent protein associated domain-containing protein n=1 Tax=Motiliproteus coralliicola TaxID=2283196 RepID=A0A369WTW8_9GAMM|nr:hypothetical protein [Motiliproteus coralliicola]RDE25122.1 hypothetical protein DV711_06075 [Motiliproteus coralliicola]
MGIEQLVDEQVASQRSTAADSNAAVASAIDVALDSGKFSRPLDSGGDHTYDGDTNVDGGERIRSPRIDTPEIKVSGSPHPQAYAVEARNRRQELLATGRFIRQPSGQKGRYGRALDEYVDPETGETLDDVLIAEGYARPDYAGRDDDQAQLAARIAELEYRETGSLPVFDDQADPTSLRHTKPRSSTDNRNPFTRAVHRGTDMMQATNFATMNAFGNLVGADVIAEWGEEGIIRNLREAAESPPEIATTDDIQTLGDFGMFWLEALGEQLPNFAVDALGVAAGVATLGAASIPLATRAALGKAMKAKLGDKVYSAYVRKAMKRRVDLADTKVGRELAGEVLPGARAAALKRGGKAGAVGAIYGQVAGESRITQLEEGVDDPIAALTAGIPKTALEYASLRLLLGKAAESVGVNPSSFAELVGLTGKRLGVSFAGEGSTEALQQVTDFVALELLKGNEYDLVSDDNLHETFEAFIKGGLVGGGISGLTSLAGGGYRMLAGAPENTAPGIERQYQLEDQTEPPKGQMEFDLGEPGGEVEQSHVEPVSNELPFSPEQQIDLPLPPTDAELGDMVLEMQGLQQRVASEGVTPQLSEDLTALMGRLQSMQQQIAAQDQMESRQQHQQVRQEGLTPTPNPEKKEAALDAVEHRVPSEVYAAEKSAVEANFGDADARIVGRELRTDAKSGREYISEIAYGDGIEGWPVDPETGLGMLVFNHPSKPDKPLSDHVAALNEKGNPKGRFYTLSPTVIRDGDKQPVQYILEHRIQSASQPDIAVELSDGSQTTETGHFDSAFAQARKVRHNKAQFSSADGGSTNVAMLPLVLAALDVDSNSTGAEVGGQQRVKNAVAHALTYLFDRHGLTPVGGELSADTLVFKQGDREVRFGDLAARRKSAKVNAALSIATKHREKNARAAEQNEWSPPERAAEGKGDAQQVGTDDHTFGDQDKKPVKRDIAGDPITYSTRPKKKTHSRPWQYKTPIPAGVKWSKFEGVIAIGDTVGKLEQEFIAKAMRLGKLTMPVVLADVRGFQAMAKANMVPSARATMALSAMKADATIRARLVPNGDHFVVLVRPVSKGKAESYQRGARVMEIAHELGHIYYDRLRQDISAADVGRLKGAYTKAVSSGTYKDGQFEEWFADQVARQVRRISLSQKAPDTLFSRIAKRLKDFFDGLFADSRFDVVSTRFDKFFAKVISGRQVVDTQSDAGYGEIKNFTLDPIVSAVRQAANPGRIRLLGTRIKRALQQGDWIPFFLRTADRELRGMGPNGKLLADMFYRQSNTEAGHPAIGHGLFQLITNRSGQWLNALSKLQNSLRDSGATDEEIALALQRMQRGEFNHADAVTQKVQSFLSRFWDYAKEGVADLGKLTDGYFPRIYNMVALRDNPQGFKEVLRQYFPNMNVDEVYSDIMGEVNGGFLARALGPGAGGRRSRNLQADGFDAALVEAGFIDADPLQALGQYVQSMTKRVEFERMFGDWGESTGLDEHGQPIRRWDGGMRLREMIGYLGREDQDRALKIIDGYFGRLGIDMSPQARKLMSGVMVAETYLTLLFSTLASLPDVVGPILRSKTFDGALRAIRAQSRALKDRKDLIARYRTMGIVNHRLTNQALLEQYGLNHLSGFAQQSMDWFFRHNLQEQWTDMTRVMSSAVAEEFLAHHANSSSKESAQYLRQLNIQADEIQSWQAAGQPTWSPNVKQGRAKPGGGRYTAQDEAANATARRVQDAIGQFTDESIVRPNAAQRPLWASDPRFMLLWHLKSFFYAYGKVVIGGVYRNTLEAWNNASGTRAKRAAVAAVPTMMAGMFLLPLAGLGLELRELIQYGGARAPSDKMDEGEWLAELISRAGVYGPLELGFSYLDAEDYGSSGVVALMGPAFQHLEVLMTDPWNRKISRSLPVVNQVPWLRSELGLSDY